MPHAVFAQTDVRGGGSAGSIIAPRDGTPRELTGRGDRIDPSKIPPSKVPPTKTTSSSFGNGEPPVSPATSTPSPATPVPVVPVTADETGAVYESVKQLLGGGSGTATPPPVRPVAPPNPQPRRVVSLPVVDPAVREAWETRLAAMREGALVFNMRPEDCLTPEELAAGWVLLFDAQTLFGWRSLQSTAAIDAAFRIQDSAIVTAAAPTPFLYSTAQFGNGLLRFNYRADTDADVRLCLRSSPRPTSDGSDSYTIVLRSPDHAVGTFLERQDGVRTPPSDKASWNGVTVLLNGPRVQLVLNGTMFIDYLDTASAPLQRGYIGLQVLRGAAEFRQIAWQPRRKPLMESLPKDLVNWDTPPNPTTVLLEQNGGSSAIRCIGPNSLTTRDTFDNFVLQFDYQIPYAGTAAEVVVRAGADGSGYRVSLQNTPTPDERKAVLGCDAGGIIGFKMPRYTAPRDEVWNTMTISVVDRHIQTWVNGIPVCEWSDRRSLDVRDAGFITSGNIRFEVPAASHLLLRRVFIATVPPRR
ncbi:MAG: 3-keto-disaccharide hydrolase [Thermoguttaceae bacterium]